MKTITLLSAAAVVALIAELSKDAHSVQERIHIAGCSTLDHIRAHGDTSGAVALMNALPNGQRVKALGAWYKHFSKGKLVMVQDKATKVWEAKLAKGRTDEDFDIAGACKTSFADLTEERDPVTLTVESLIKSLESKAGNLEYHSDGTTPKVSPEARNLCSEILAFVRAKRADKNVVMN